MLHWLSLDPREIIPITQSCKFTLKDQTQTASPKAPLNVSAEAMLPSNLRSQKLVDILLIVPAVMGYALAPAAPAKQLRTYVQRQAVLCSMLITLDF